MIVNSQARGHRPASGHRGGQSAHRAGVLCVVGLVPGGLQADVENLQVRAIRAALEPARGRSKHQTALATVTRRSDACCSQSIAVYQLCFAKSAAADNSNAAVGGALYRSTACGDAEEGYGACCRV